MAGISPNSFKPRQAFLSLLYEGKDISADIAPYVLSFSYTDNAHGKADDLNVKLEDRDHLWKGDWYPEKGATLIASIRCENWESPGSTAKIMRCGSFTLDEIELSGPPDTVVVKAMSAAVTKALRQQRKTKAWENTSLQQVAKDIAGTHGLQLVYDGPEFKFTRMDQRETSDLGFLKRMAEQRGMLLKVADDSIILMSAKGYDAKAPVKTITRGIDVIKSFHFKDKTDGTYGDGAEINYHDPAGKQDKKFTFVNPYNETSQTYASGTGKQKKRAERLMVNRRIDDQEDGVAIVAAACRKKNKDESDAGLTLMGDLDLRSTMTVAVAGFKRFDATYLIDIATHAYDHSAGYTTDIKLKKTLDY